MSRSLARFALVLGLTAAVLTLTSQVPSAAAAEGESAPAGRYQLVTHLDGRILIIDTATGQCWSKYPGNRRWQEEGNPVRSAVASTDADPADVGGESSTEESIAAEPQVKPQLALPSESVDMTISQNTTRPIPGSQGTVRIHLDDITEGQVLLTVRTHHGDELVSTTSVRTGETVHFTVEEQRYAVHINELRNILIGRDFARLTIRQEPTAEGKAAAGKNADKGAQGDARKEAAGTP